MTKTEKQAIKKAGEKAMLKWRLANKPTLKDVEKMLDLEIISKEEARQMLFSEETENEKIKALEEQVEFLKSVIDKMPYNSPQVVYQYITRYVPQYTWTGTPWHGTTVLVGSNTVKTLASAGTGGTLTGGSGTTVGYASTSGSSANNIVDC